MGRGYPNKKKRPEQKTLLGAKKRSREQKKVLLGAPPERYF
jgi:hypothetical protein